MVGLGIGGLVIGLVIAMLISFAFAQIHPDRGSLSSRHYIVLIYCFLQSKREDILQAFQSAKREKDANVPVGQKALPRQRRGYSQTTGYQRDH